MYRLTKGYFYFNANILLAFYLIKNKKPTRLDSIVMSNRKR